MAHCTIYMHRKEEPVITLAKRVARTPQLILDDLPTGQNPRLPTPGRTRLSRETQRMVFVMIDMLDDILNVEPRQCLQEITAANIVFTMDGSPRLINVTLVGYTDKLATSNYGSLAHIIHHDILLKSRLQIPIEVTHLLYLMRRQPLTMGFVIVNHSSLAPMETRSYMYLNQFQYVYGLMYRSPDLEALLYILGNLLFDPAWATKILARNQYLAGYLKRADYDPHGTKPGRFPGLEVMRYGRNGPEHPFDEALDLTSAFASRFNSTEIAHMFYANLPLLLCSLSAALHRQGRLRYLNPRPFFTSLSKPVAATSDGFDIIQQGT